MFGVGYQHQARIQVLLRKAAHRARQARVIKIAVNVRIHHGERRGAQQRQCLRDAAGGLERLGFARIGDVDAEARASTERRFDYRAQMRMIDDDPGKPRRRQFFDMPDDQRFAARHQQGLGSFVGERTHALAASGGGDHGLQNV